jgi:GH35 family endo-1,4-beta-xylanase
MASLIQVPSGIAPTSVKVARHFFVASIIFIASVFGIVSNAPSQTSLTGSSLAYDPLDSATLSQTSNLGTYLVVPSGGATVDFDVNATGAGSAAHMNISIANSQFGFNISGTSATDYESQNVTLPAGTYFVSVQRDYDGGVNQAFTLNNLSVNTVSGGTATFANDDMTTAAGSNDAINAATTYINNYRKGNLNLSVLGAAPGTPVEVKETNSAFKWGTAVPDTISTYLNNSTYTNILKKDFNSVEPENAGKWSESDSNLSQIDALMNFAQQNNMRVRMHNLIWGSQQPSDINTDFTNARSTNPTTAATAKAAITSRITGRINSYVAGNNSTSQVPRATQFAELDVYNESYHTGAGASASTGDNYWQVMGGSTAGGASWTANLYNQVQTSLNSVGSSAKLFTNEYNVLNSNGDNYGQWYSQHVESIRNGNGPNTGGVSGIGTEWYNSTAGVGTSTGGGDSQVNAARAYGTWQNLAAQGLPLEVTEFGESVGSATDEANGLTTAMTLAFGTPQMTGFQLWGFYYYGSSMFSQAQGSVLYNGSYQITAAGTAYEALHNSYTTDVTTTVNTDGTVTLPNGAFYGDYAAIINGKSYTFTYDASTNSYQVVVTPVLGDFNRDGHVTAADVVAMEAALADLPDYEAAQGMNSTYLDSIGDFNHDGVVNNADLQGLLDYLKSGGGSSGAVPEPVSLALLSLGGLALFGVKLRSHRAA